MPLNHFLFFVFQIGKVKKLFFEFVPALNYTFNLDLGWSILAMYSSQLCLSMGLILLKKENWFSLVVSAKRETYSVLGNGDNKFEIYHS